MKVLVTGLAGFIGFHLAKRILQNPEAEVYGIDSINEYYDPELKLARLASLGLDRSIALSGREAYAGTRVRFTRMNLNERRPLNELFEKERFDFVCHLAAQAGVRASLTNPFSYTESNIEGTLSILEACRSAGVKHLVYASSSSVYGLNTMQPFRTSQNVDHPASLYAATKKSCELMAHAYSHLFGIPTTGLRFFTVYGPWGRPDMALFLFTRAILRGEPIKLFNEGRMLRDFTYIDDITEAIYRTMLRPTEPAPAWNHFESDPSRSSAPYRVFNIGNNAPVPLQSFVEVLEDKLGKKAVIQHFPMQSGDIESTWADVEDLYEWIEFQPRTSIADGIERFVRWYRSHYNE